MLCTNFWFLLFLNEQTTTSFHTFTLKLLIIQNYRLTVHNMHICST